MKMLKVLPIFLMMMFVVASCGDKGTDDKCEGVTCENGQVCLKSSGKCVDKGTDDKCEGVTCDDGMSCDPTDGVCKATSSNLTIVELRQKLKAACTSGEDFCNLKDGEGSAIVTVSGVVTGVKGGTGGATYGVYIQQADKNEFAGIYVMIGDKNAKVELATAPVVGDMVEVTGQALEFHTYAEMKVEEAGNFKITANGVAVPAPIKIDVSQIEGDKYESMLVELNGGPFTVTEAASTDNHKRTTLSDGKNTFYMSSYLMHPEYDLPNDTKLTKIVGLVNLYFDWKIQPRSDADLVKATK